MGKIGNCQVGVFLSYAAPETGHTLIDRRLYLKQEWFTSEWDEMRERAHVPEDVVFRTKIELALEMIEAARARRVPHAWINVDADYGKVTELLDHLDARGERYAAQVPCSTPVWTEKPRTYIPPRKRSRGRHPTKSRLVGGEPLRGLLPGREVRGYRK
jgi:SRSO17 transposase